MDSKLLAAAIQYARRGWHVFPLIPGGKVPLTDHGFYDASTDPGTIREWWRRWPRANIGIRTGQASRLLVIDADGEEALAKLRDLSTRLGQLPRGPRVKTARGWHGYFSTDSPVPSRKIEGVIDIKSEGGYVVAPPSVHPSGIVYTWQPPPNDAPPPFLPESWLQYLSNACYRENRESICYRENRESICYRENGGDSGGCASLRESNALDRVIEAAISETLPTGPGQRHRAIFELVRRLKAIPDIANADAMDLLPIIREWHRLALPVIRTKAFEETLADFLDGWERVRFAYGESPIEIALARAREAPPPPEAEIFDDPRLKLLVALCAELQRLQGNAAFFLSCRAAGKAVEVDHMTVSRWLKVLAKAGILQIEVQAERSTGRATRYRYIAKSPCEANDIAIPS